MTSAPPPAPQNGTIDVKPTDLYRVSGRIALEQGVLDRGAGQFLRELDGHSNVGGAGKAADAFNAAYMEVGERILKVWAKSVVSVGGAAVGFTVTANHYVTADAHSNPAHKGPPATRPLPQVIRQVSPYGKVPVLKWDGIVDDGDDGFFADVIDGIDHAAEAIVRPLIHHAMRWGKVAELLPLPDSGALDKVSASWLHPGIALAQVDGNLTGLVGSITNQANSEWYSAMRTFCSAVWGTTAWGRSREGYQWKHDSASAGGSNHPALAVLFDTCDTVSDAVRQYAEAAYDMRLEVSKIYRKAVKDALGGLDLSDGFGIKDLKSLAKGAYKMGKSLGQGITLEIDEGALNAAVTRYESRLHDLVPKLNARLAPLDEALMSLPDFDAEEARAEGFGSRSLNEFKHEHKWTNPDDTNKGIYHIDLAANEELDGGHTLDKHVGKSDQQLAQRLRDQGNPPTDAWPHGKPSIGASSTFENAEEAQRLTQYNIDQRAGEIKAWLDKPPSDGEKEAFDGTAPPGQNSGRSVTKQSNPQNNSGYKSDGINAKAIPVQGIRTVLKYDRNLDPPFVVLTCTPQQ
ncbi:hypothetical protein QZH56_20480 [Streptomyces olivoreticuli]|uniref:RNase A-like domain-containing protein n=1 Tax=Streptomyces olivoreticuli TaxID=68246 RepID=UPI002658AD46|nr:RNase A-like domain-containing protein [Streptomyces olivoreticuli]WKK21242.1 hypothetical protein QZH56_20480 [Streptomyces olivoreticuli]